VSNALSFLQAQQASLLHLSDIVGRMAAISTRMQDVSQTSDDKESYALEFVALQREMVSLSSAQFNGNDLFSTTAGAASTLDVLVSEDAKQVVKIDRSNLTTVQTYNLSTANPATGYTPDNYNTTWFAADITVPTTDPIGNPTFFSTIEISLESVAKLLASNGSQQGLLHEALHSLRQSAVTIEQAHGQMADTDIAASSREMAKASALMESGSVALSKAMEVPKTLLDLLNPPA
jgi:flagellin-like hook-associated protein FlgL